MVTVLQRNCLVKESSVTQPADKRLLLYPHEAVDGKAFEASGTGFFRFLTEAKHTQGRWSFHECRLVRGVSGPPMHVHLIADEAFFVLEGEALFEFPDRSMVTGPGGFVFIPKGQPHRFDHASPDQDVLRVLTLFSPAGFEPFFESLPAKVNEGSWPPSSQEHLNRISQQFDIAFLDDGQEP
jgi:mannose-6-phosphate isomerase-like protein (cupin superfamily)